MARKKDATSYVVKQVLAVWEGSSSKSEIDEKYGDSFMLKVDDRKISSGQLFYLMKTTEGKEKDGELIYLLLKVKMLIYGTKDWDM